MARGRWRRALGVVALSLYALTIVVGAVFVRNLRPYFDTPWFRQALLGTLIAAAVIGAALAVAALRRNTLRRLAGLALVALAVVAALRLGPNVSDPAGRLREQTHLAQYGLMALLYTLVFRHRHSDGALYTGAALFSVCVGMVDEAVQWWVPGRVGALEDIRLDLWAALLGAGLAALVVQPGGIGPQLTRTGGGATLKGLAVTFLMLGGFIHLVHLGHGIDLVREGVRLRSRYSPADLTALSRDWTPLPPPRSQLEELRRGSDFYSLEAQYQLARRNASLAAGEQLRVFQHQLVLERYYASYLAFHPEAALPSEVAAGLKGLSDESPRSPYDTGPDWLFVGFDPLTLWLAAIALASVLGLAGELLLLRR